MVMILRLSLLAWLGVLSTPSFTEARSSAGRGLREAAVHRELTTYQRLAGYRPVSLITDQAAIDLDVEAMKRALDKEQFQDASIIYNDGGNSRSYAELTLKGFTNISAIAIGSKVIGKGVNGQQTTGTIMDLTPIRRTNSSLTIPVFYTVFEDPKNYVECKMGGLVSVAGGTKSGCFNSTGHVTIVPPKDLNLPEAQQLKLGRNVSYSYDVQANNRNARTLAKFSTMAKDNMRFCDSCAFYRDYQTFVEYYGSFDYANVFVQAAFQGNATHFMNKVGHADFSKQSTKARAEAISTGSIVLNVIMEVIRNLESATVRCAQGCKDDSCRHESVHEIDAALATYAGSLVGKDGSSDGHLLYSLANQFCAEFKTCGNSSTEESGNAFVNDKIIREMKKMQANLAEDACNAAITSKYAIVELLKIPLIQGLLFNTYHLKHTKSHLSDPVTNVPAAATYAAALLPWISKCDRASAQLIHEQVVLQGNSNTTNPDFHAIKSTLEKHYGCLGVRCLHVGGIWKQAEGSYASDARPVGILLIAFAIIRTRRRQKKTSVKGMVGNIAAVSEIS